MLFDGLNPERLVVASQAVGVGRWSLERATAYARERVVFDVPIGAHQAVQHPLAESLDRARGRLGADGARRRASSTRASRPGSSRTWRRSPPATPASLAADRSLQVFGGSGYTDETMMLQRFTYMRLLRSIPVARELALNHIATSGLGLPRSY